MLAGQATRQGWTGPHKAVWDYLAPNILTIPLEHTSWFLERTAMLLQAMRCKSV